MCVVGCPLVKKILQTILLLLVICSLSAVSTAAKATPVVVSSDYCCSSSSLSSSSSATLSSSLARNHDDDDKVLWTVGPICLWPTLRNKQKQQSQPGFTWQASLNRHTGLACSCEDSSIPDHSTLFRQCTISIQNDDRHLLELSKRLFTSYPKWLCRPSVSLGLLRLVVVDDDDNNVMRDKKKKILHHGGGGGYTSTTTSPAARLHVKDVIFGCTLLSFGRPTGKHKKISYTTTVITNNSMGQANKSAADSTTKTTTTSEEYVWSLPLVGGLMLYNNYKRQKDEQKRKRDDALLFILRKTTTTTTSGNVPNDNNKINSKRNNQDKMSSAKSSLNNFMTMTTSHHRCSIQTRIISYRPAMVGGPRITDDSIFSQCDQQFLHSSASSQAQSLPSPPSRRTSWIRSGLYLSTQSWIHAYVMWRFHRYCYNWNTDSPTNMQSS